MRPEEIKYLDLNFKLAKAKELLEKCHPYIKRHYEGSRAGYGVGAMKLMKEMQELCEQIANLQGS